MQTLVCFMFSRRLISILSPRSISFIFYALILFFCSTTSSPANANDDSYSLTLKPQECVSLYRGQTCYLTLNFSFSAPVSGQYCVYLKDDNKRLQCAPEGSTGEFSFEFETNKDLIFEMRVADVNSDKNKTVLASSVLTVSWVYEIPKKKRLDWRLF